MDMTLRGSLPDIVSDFLGGVLRPVASICVFERWDNLSAIPHIDCPVLLLHGLHDSIIPWRHSKELYDFLPSASSSQESVLLLLNTDHQFSNIEGQVRREIALFLRKALSPHNLETIFITFIRFDWWLLRTKGRE
jgi:pimeloyl-ACP methyl ester carboxylesterase